MSPHPCPVAAKPWPASLACLTPSAAAPPSPRPLHQVGHTESRGCLIFAEESCPFGRPMPSACLP
jgi:hypothetical protein